MPRREDYSAHPMRNDVVRRAAENVQDVLAQMRDMPYDEFGRTIPNYNPTVRDAWYACYSGERAAITAWVEWSESQAGWDPNP